MPEPGPSSERLEALRERWQADPGSRVFLQLADELRRLGRPEEAARVLEEGLEAHPSHLGAQVALGRSRLELGQPREAAELLERVVESDPTQMVAYRLLVDAYLQQGKAEEARQRLRIYGLLNDADPEIAELRRRIGELDRGRGEDTAATSERTARGPEPRSDSGSEPGRQEPSPAAAAGEPFPALASSEARHSYLQALAAEGLFEIDLEAGWEAGAATELQPAGTRAAERPAWGEVFDLGAPGGAPEPDLASLLDSSQSVGEPSPDRSSDRPTVTLGRLYLRQGHLREAEEIFRGVLAVEPGNAEARRHLGELEAAPASAEPRPAGSAREPGPALGAAELLAGLAGGEGVSERKRYVLERYLERVRGRAQRDVH